MCVLKGMRVCIQNVCHRLPPSYHFPWIVFYVHVQAWAVRADPKEEKSSAKAASGQAPVTVAADDTKKSTTKKEGKKTDTPVAAAAAAAVAAAPQAKDIAQGGTAA